MAHTTEEKKKLLNRVRRIMGQVAAIERVLDQEGECADVLQTISACHQGPYPIPHTPLETPRMSKCAADDLVVALRAYVK